MGGISRGDSDMIRLLTSPGHHFIALAGLLFLAAIGHASEPQEPLVENTLEPNPSISQLYSRQLEDYQSGRGDSNRNEMAKSFMEDYNPSYFGGRGFKSVGQVESQPKRYFGAPKRYFGAASPLSSLNMAYFRRPYRKDNLQVIRLKRNGNQLKRNLQVIRLKRNNDLENLGESLRVIRL